MKLVFHPMDRPAALEIARWRYEPPYDFYNLEEAEDTLGYALDPAHNFYRLEDENGSLVGFCSFGEDGQVAGGDYAAEALDIGMGIRPDLTGQGGGADFAAAVLAFACQKYHPVRFRVTIAAFNQRAQKVWQKLGFRQTQSFRASGSVHSFVVMVRDSLA